MQNMKKNHFEGGFHSPKSLAPEVSSPQEEQEQKAPATAEALVISSEHTEKHLVSPDVSWYKGLLTEHRDKKQQDARAQDIVAHWQRLEQDLGIEASNQALSPHEHEEAEDMNIYKQVVLEILDEELYLSTRIEGQHGDFVEDISSVVIDSMVADRKKRAGTASKKKDLELLRSYDASELFQNLVVFYLSFGLQRLVRGVV